MQTLLGHHDTHGPLCFFDEGAITEQKGACVSADMFLGGSHNGFCTTARGQPSRSAADQASPEHRLHAVPCVSDQAANTAQALLSLWKWAGVERAHEEPQGPHISG